MGQISKWGMLMISELGEWLDTKNHSAEGEPSTLSGV